MSFGTLQTISDISLVHISDILYSHIHQLYCLVIFFYLYSLVIFLVILLLQESRASFLSRQSCETRKNLERESCFGNFRLRKQDFLTLAEQAEVAKAGKRLRKQDGLRKQERCESRNLTLRNRRVAKAGLLRNEESCETMRPL